VRRLRKLALVSLLGIAFLALVGEVAVRTFGRSMVYERDDVLGWRPKADFSARLTARDQTGASYDVDYSAGSYGFRAFGDASAGRERVLFVGDSFTGDPNTSNAESYFGVVAERLPVEVFAIGGSGYGTLQELLLVRQLAGVVKPDVFVLQYCPNDLSDNSFAIESRMSHVRNQKNLRPYLVGDAIVFRLPKRHPYLLLYENSRLFRKLDFELMVLQFALDQRSGATHDAEAIATERAASVALTTDLLSKIAAAMPRGTRLITFSCDTSSREETETWQAIAHAAGFEAATSVSEAVEAAERGGQAVRIADGMHWNRLGNRIAGEELARVIGERRR